LLLAVLIYAFFYWRGLGTSERYARGFVIETCPVCQRGKLQVESRPERFLGIPRYRHTVRCTECRSTLRETEGQRWRYAIDPLDNPELYRRFNGQEIDEQKLIELSRRPVRPGEVPPPRGPSVPPSFLDDQSE
jgi:hypothetical protein